VVADELFREGVVQFLDGVALGLVDVVFRVQVVNEFISLTNAQTGV
jgi:hypothetical protein